MKKYRLPAILLVLILLCGCFTGCAAGKSQEAYDTGAYVMTPNAYDYKSDSFAVAEETTMEAPSSYYGPESPEAEPAESTPQSDDAMPDPAAKIIYTAWLNIETTEFDRTVAALEQSVKSYGGFVESSGIYGDTRYNQDGTTRIVNRNANYTVRIPAEKFEAFLHESGQLGNVTSSSRSADNITSRYTDYEARLSSLNTQEERLLDMLAKSEDVETLIALEQRLADVRYEIEAIERTLRNYDMQIAYSTFELTIREVEIYTPTAPVTRTFGQKLSDAFSSGWSGFARGFQSFLIGVTEALPSLILLAVVVIVIVVIVRRSVRKRRAKKASSDRQMPPPPQQPQPPQG